MSIERALKLPKSSFFLWGCRGTGKSTWLRESLPDAKFFDLLNEALYQQLLANPALFRAALNPLQRGSWVVIDEVQRLPNLLNEVHSAIERQGLKFVLCGSSARKLKRAGVNLLAGRASLKRMHPFMLNEMAEHYDIEDALIYGCIPIIWDSDEREERLKAYTQLYLKEEIQAEALTRNLPGFARFLPIAALFNGQTLNISNIARDCAVARTTVSAYLDILEETMLTFKVPAYEARLRVKERKAPKLYWCDPGLVRTIKQQTGPVEAKERGPLFESLVAQHLRAAIDYFGLCNEFYYWASAQNSTSEVDFMLFRGDQSIAIEAKSGFIFHESWCKGLRAIANLTGLKRRLIVYPHGDYLSTSDGIEIIPFRMLCDLLANDSLF
jgi:predicted AAA+ superfamily ATPase